MASTDNNGLLSRDALAADPHLGEIRAHIERRRQGRSDPKRNLIILAVTLFIFFSVARFGGLTDVVLVIAVLLVHELGHLAAMRLFGYKNVQMFFIPMLGAAVSGTSHNVATWKKAIVCLMGPLPGVVLGLIIGAVYIVTDHLLLRRMMLMFLGINIFNLLPFYPLDGGRFLREILFSRNRYAELIFRILASGGLLLLAVASGMWILAAFVAVGLLTIGPTFKMAGIATTLRPQVHRSSRRNSRSLQSTASAFEWPSEIAPNPYGLTSRDCHAGEGRHPDQPPIAPATPQYAIHNTQDEHIPDETLRAILGEIRRRMSPKANTATLAFYADEIWDRMHIRPAGILPTVLLLLAYAGSFLVPLTAGVAGAVVYHRRHSRPLLESKIVESREPDGRVVQKEMVYSLGGLVSETQLSDDGTLYHGPHTYYYDTDSGSVYLRGHWSKGRPDGSWRQFDRYGNLTSVTTWDNGRFVSYEDVRDGRRVSIPLEDVRSDVREAIEFLRDCPPQGPTRSSFVVDDPNAAS